MKKIMYALAALLMLAGLSSCDGEIKNVKINNLVGTWDLVTTTTVGHDGSVTTTNHNQGDSYMLIEKESITIGSGRIQTRSDFSFGDPYFIIDGDSRYELVSLTRNQMVLKSNSLVVSILVKEQTLTYQRR